MLDKPNPYRVVHVDTELEPEDDGSLPGFLASLFLLCCAWFIPGLLASVVFSAAAAAVYFHTNT